MARKKLGEMLVEAGALTEQSLRMALNEQRRWGGTLGRILVDMKLISEPELVRTLSAQLHLPTIELDKIEIPPAVLDLVPGELAEQYSIIPFAQPMKFLDVAMADPTNLGVIDELRIRTQLNIRPYLAGPKMIERALGRCYSRGFSRAIDRMDVMIDTGDLISDNADASDGRPLPSDDEINAARRREGLAPRSKPTVVPRTAPLPGSGGVSIGVTRDAEINALQDRISRLEALVERDEEVLRKLLALLVEKNVATRDEILERIR